MSSRSHDDCPGKPAKPPESTPRQVRTARLADALKANLQRRKAQARGRSAAQKAGAQSAADSRDGDVDPDHKPGG